LRFHLLIQACLAHQGGSEAGRSEEIFGGFSPRSNWKIPNKPPSELPASPPPCSFSNRTNHEHGDGGGDATPTSSPHPHPQGPYARNLPLSTTNRRVATLSATPA